jgi:stalled ribosome rescue protein Dom34
MRFAGYVLFVSTKKKHKADRHTTTTTTTTTTTKITQEKHKWKRAECDLVKKKGKKAAKQNPSRK